MESLAALFREVGAPVSIERIALDPPGPTEVLVRIAAVGLCRTDYHVMRGERAVAMRPMVLREIADMLTLHESTISRVTTQKYMLTPRGTYELKYFFGSHVATDTGGAAFMRPAPPAMWANA